MSSSASFSKSAAQLVQRTTATVGMSSRRPWGTLMMVLRGERSSWDVLARNSLFKREASVALPRARSRATF
jgi:hypothetical protein